jgi:hypothetical protein
VLCGIQKHYAAVFKLVIEPPSDEKRVEKILWFLAQPMQ